MEAKDTVIDMHNPQIMPDIYYSQQNLLRRQAEISFDAGYNKALAQLADMTEECKQIGRKEVVEWAKGYYTTNMDYRDFLYGERYIQIPLDEWQAKLKEWNVKTE